MKPILEDSKTKDYDTYKDVDYERIVEQLNDETKAHSHSVAHICRAIAGELGLNEEVAYKIGLLHDIGKIYIPSRILKKNGRLTDIEREVVDLHSYYGYRILKTRGEPPLIYIPVLFHHGFNKVRLMVEDEPISDEDIDYTYLIHSVDIYDAMISKRAYHIPISFNVVYQILNEDPLCPDRVLNSIVKYDTFGQYAKAEK